MTAAWFGSLCNGPIGDRFGRKASMLIAVVIFTIGSAIQCSAQNIPMLFAGRAVAGLAIGQLTQIVPLFISEVTFTSMRWCGVCLTINWCLDFRTGD